ncbi:MAG: hypothetical protein R2854_08680 [Caldilineaceae bacterium]
MEDGDRLDEYGLDGYVLHTPGHTPGSSTLIVDDQYAFAGDLVSATGSPHAQNSYAFSWLRVAESLARLQELDPTLTFAGHGTEPITAPELESLSVQFGDRQLPAATGKDAEPHDARFPAQAMSSTPAQRRTVYPWWHLLLEGIIAGGVSAWPSSSRRAARSWPCSPCWASTGWAPGCSVWCNFLRPRAPIAGAGCSSTGW